MAAPSFDDGWEVGSGNARIPCRLWRGSNVFAYTKTGPHFRALVISPDSGKSVELASEPGRYANQTVVLVPQDLPPGPCVLDIESNGGWQMEFIHVVPGGPVPTPIPTPTVVPAPTVSPVPTEARWSYSGGSGVHTFDDCGIDPGPVRFDYRQESDTRITVYLRIGGTEYELFYGTERAGTRHENAGVVPEGSIHYGPCIVQVLANADWELTIGQ